MNIWYTAMIRLQNLNSTYLTTGPFDLASTPSRTALVTSPDEQIVRFLEEHQGKRNAHSPGSYSQSLFKRNG